MLHTPRGLKLRLDPAYVFALLARLGPEARPLDVLRTTEALERVPPAFACVAALGAVVLGAEPPAACAATAVGYAAFGAMTQWSVLLFRPVVTLGRWYRMRWPFVGVLAGALLGRGWRTAAAIVLGRVIGGAANGLVELLRSRRYLREVGRALTGAEVNFFSAYRLHARALGRPASLAAPDAGELERGRELMAHSAISSSSASGP
ncbi:MAG TPA: hypothetical protein VJS92_14555 [Candidatus Polarisedimenticolaceae bacterium]|nr:hypothetical protein [Candidatus Polarisedimenticolaceae bacterium]